MSREKPYFRNLAPAVASQPAALSNIPPRPDPDITVLIGASVSPNTCKAYRGALQRLDTWLAGRCLDDHALAAWIASLHGRGLSASTASMAVAAARFRARVAGKKDPAGRLTRRTLAGIRRSSRGRGRGQATGVTWEEVDRAVEDAMGEGTLRGMRDAALIAVASDALLRVSEMVGIDVEDIERDPDGSAVLHIRYSKSDPEGVGTTCYLGRSTVAVLDGWMAGWRWQGSGCLERPGTVHADRCFVPCAREVPWEAGCQPVRRVPLWPTGAGGVGKACPGIPFAWVRHLASRVQVRAWWSFSRPGAGDLRRCQRGIRARNRRGAVQWHGCGMGGKQGGDLGLSIAGVLRAVLESRRQVELWEPEEVLPQNRLFAIGSDDPVYQNQPTANSGVRHGSPDAHHPNSALTPVRLWK